MPRSIKAQAGLLCLALSPLFAQAPIFPEELGEFTKNPPKTVSLPDRELYSEYGLEASEQADYKAPGKQFSASGWRFKDATGAMAVYQLRRPSGAPAGKLTDLAVATGDGIILAMGNYVFQFTGQVPPKQYLERIYVGLPKWEQSPLPALIGFLPVEGLIPNSERYVVGPVSLERFLKGVSPSVAAFHVGAEAQIGRYRSTRGELTLGIFNYPTPNLARASFEEFQKVPGALAKRSGPLVAVVMNPRDADAAERLLSRVRYEANLTPHEAPKQEFNKGLSNMILSIMALAGIFISLSIIAGVGFGGFRVLRRKMGGKQEQEEFTVIHLGEKSPRV